MSSSPDGLPVPRRYASIAAIVLTMSLCVLEAGIVNVALPSIARDFHATTSHAIWVLNAYLISILVALLPLASLGEQIGYRRVAQIGLALFTMASLACALSNSLLTLCIARTLQGLGAAGIMSASGALIRHTYPQLMLGRAIGLNTFFVGLNSVIGPPLSSSILAIADWRWLFAMIVPLGVLAFVVGARALPAPDPSRRPFNYVGTLLNIGAFGLLISGMQSLSHEHGAALAAAEMAAGVLLAWLFARHELGKPDPLLPFDLLKVPRFSLSILTSVTAFVAATVALTSLPFEIERIGYGAAQIGLLMAPWPVALTVVAPIAGRLADRYSADILGGVGLTLLSGGLLCLALYTPGRGTVDFLWPTALCGVGFALFQTPNNRVILSSAPLARSGAAGAMLNAGRLLGQSLGATAVALLFRFFPLTGSSRALQVAALTALAAAIASLTRLAAADAK